MYSRKLQFFQNITSNHYMSIEKVWHFYHTFLDYFSSLSFQSFFFSFLILSRFLYSSCESVCLSLCRKDLDIFFPFYVCVCVSGGYYPPFFCSCHIGQIETSLNMFCAFCQIVVWQVQFKHFIYFMGICPETDEISTFFQIQAQGGNNDAVFGHAGIHGNLPWFRLLLEISVYGWTGQTVFFYWLWIDRYDILIESENTILIESENTILIESENTIRE